MRKQILYFFLVSLLTYVSAQNCIVEESGDINNRFDQEEVLQYPKFLRVTIHFILDDDGTNNFGPIRNEYNGFKNGYDFSEELKNYFNSSYRNIALNIPSPNNLGVTDKDIEMVVDGVYFHYNTLRNNHNYNRSGTYNAYKINPDKSFQLFIVTRGGGGSASTTSQNSSNKYGFMSFSFDRYLSWLQDNESDMYDWITHGTFEGMGHEVLHLLGLNHTVRYNWGMPIPSSVTSDYDGCDDTPSPWEMENIYGSDHHPACSWGEGNTYGCSNNWMDYSGSTALSPCQKSKIHYGLENGLMPYSICNQLSNNNLITAETQILYPIRTIIANKIKIEPNSTIIIENERKELYFHEEILIEEGFEIRQGSNFETIYLDYCQEVNL